MFKTILNNTNILAIKALILQLNMKYFPIWNNCENVVVLYIIRNHNGWTDFNIK